MIEEAAVLVEAQDFEMAMAKYHEIMAADPDHLMAWWYDPLFCWNARHRVGPGYCRSA